MKWIIVTMLLLIVASLGAAGVFLVRDGGRSRNVLRSLGVRIGLSVTLFVLILFANWMGWIHNQ